MGGEAEAIVLAIEVSADLLLMDERKGRLISIQFDLAVTGLIGILIEAKQQGFIDHVKPLLDKLIFELGFRVKPSLYQEILNRIGE